MSELDDALEYDALRKFARDMGFFAQIHANFDPIRQAPGRENACWYLQRAKRLRIEPNPPTILKYQTPEELYAWLQEFRRTETV
jgi:hypothetical protein